MFIQKYMQYGTQRENMCTEVIVENPQIESYTLLENVSLVENERSPVTHFRYAKKQTILTSHELTRCVI